MTFSEQLNEYMLILNCSAKELTDASGLSASVLSRYRTGSRVPAPNSEYFTQLIYGIVKIAKESGQSDFTVEKVTQALELCLQDDDFPYESFRHNFDTLLITLSVNVADLSHFLNFDSSYISRIRNGQRRPANPLDFAQKISKYVVGYCTANDKINIAKLIHCNVDELIAEETCIDKIVYWLLNTEIEKKM